MSERYFNYHAKVKNLIQSGQAASFERKEEYHSISPCLLINMKDGNSYPIRQSHFDEYLFLLFSFGVPEKMS